MYHFSVDSVQLLDFARIFFGYNYTLLLVSVVVQEPRGVPGWLRLHSRRLT